jgi:hypothetical protein
MLVAERAPKGAHWELPVRCHLAQAHEMGCYCDLEMQQEWGAHGVVAWTTVKTFVVLCYLVLVAVQAMPGVSIAQRVLGVRRLLQVDLRMLVGVHFELIPPSPGVR